MRMCQKTKFFRTTYATYSPELITLCKETLSALPTFWAIRALIPPAYTQWKQAIFTECKYSVSGFFDVKKNKSHIINIMLWWNCYIKKWWYKYTTKHWYLSIHFHVYFPTFSKTSKIERTLPGQYRRFCGYWSGCFIFTFEKCLIMHIICNNCEISALKSNIMLIMLLFFWPIFRTVVRQISTACSIPISPRKALVWNAWATRKGYWKRLLRAIV